MERKEQSLNEKSRNPPIKESSAVCTTCGHTHDVEVIKAQYEARGRSFTSFFCHSCNAYNRIIRTRTGLMRLGSKQNKGTGKSLTIKADRMTCPHCERASFDKEDFEFLLKKRNYRRTTCQSCYGPVLVRRSSRGFYTTSKADMERTRDSIARGINRYEFDPETKQFKAIKEKFYLHIMWKQIKEQHAQDNKISN